MFFLHQEFAIILYFCLDLRGYFCLLLFCICVWILEVISVCYYFVFVFWCLLVKDRSSQPTWGFLYLPCLRRGHRFWTSSSLTSLWKSSSSPWWEKMIFLEIGVDSFIFSYDLFFMKFIYEVGVHSFIFLYDLFIYEFFLWNWSWFFLYFHMIYFFKEVFVEIEEDSFIFWNDL